MGGDRKEELEKLPSAPTLTFSLVGKTSWVTPITSQLHYIFEKSRAHNHSGLTYQTMPEYGTKII